MSNLVAPGRGVFIEGKFTDRGKWMDGWESRRKRDLGARRARLVRRGARRARARARARRRHRTTSRATAPRSRRSTALRAPPGTPIGELLADALAGRSSRPRRCARRRRTSSRSRPGRAGEPPPAQHLPGRRRRPPPRLRARRGRLEPARARRGDARRTCRATSSTSRPCATEAWRSRAPTRSSAR